MRLTIFTQSSSQKWNAKLPIFASLSVAVHSKKYDSIIFDLGGVLYDIDVQRSVRAFKDLGLHDFDRLYNLQAQSDLFDELEMGRMGKDEFEAALGEYIKGKPEPGVITNAWQALLIGMKAENLMLLRALKKQYRIYLLSNTNRLQHKIMSAAKRSYFLSFARIKKCTVRERRKIPNT